MISHILKVHSKRAGDRRYNVPRECKVVKVTTLRESFKEGQGVSSIKIRAF